VNDTELLRKLLSYFYQDRDELHWGYVEGQSVGRVSDDKDFEKQLIQRKNEKENQGNV
jgi:hypothetical protein